MNQKQAVLQLKEFKRYIKNSPRLAAEGWNKPWKTLVSTLLSARTRDEKTIEVCEALYKKYPTAKALANARLKDVEKIIRPLNFYKTKSRNIIECAKRLDKEYSREPPRDFDKLISLPGVGRKTANVFLAVYGHSKIGVDTHVSYLSQKVGWTKSKKPELIEKDLENLFPKNKWREINYILVGFGRTYKSRKQQDEIIKKIKNI